MFLEQRKDLPGSYPEGADGDLDQGYIVKSRSQSAASKPAAAGAPTGSADPAATGQELKEELIQWHFNVVEMCRKIGIKDVCQSYRSARLEKYCYLVFPPLNCSASYVRRHSPHTKGSGTTSRAGI